MPGAAPALSFAVQGAEALRPAARPDGALRAADRRPAAPRSGRCSSRSRCGSRRRSAATTRREQERLAELFGAHRRAGASTLRSFLWANLSLVVPPFDGRDRSLSLDMPCTYDFEVTAAKYLAAPARRRGAARAAVQRHGLLRGRRAPAGGADRLGPRGRLPAAGRVWREAMDQHFPERRLAALDRARPSTASPPTRRAAPARCSTWEGRPVRRRAVPSTGAARGGSAAPDSPAARPRRGPSQDRRRGALRGLRPVAVHALGAQEPAALDVRRRLPARALRAARRRRPVGDARRRCLVEGRTPARA